MLFAATLRCVPLMQEPGRPNCAGWGGWGGERPCAGGSTLFSLLASFWEHLGDSGYKPTVFRQVRQLSYKSSPGGQRTSCAPRRKINTKKRGGETPNTCFSHFKTNSFQFLFPVGN